MNADYIIVGAGSAGCALANRLSRDPSKTVLLLEAGGTNRKAILKAPAGFAAILPWPISNWALKSVPQAGLNGRRSYQPRGKGLGGSSAINAMVYARGRPADYTRWGMDGWRWKDVEPAFASLERNGLKVSKPDEKFEATQMFLNACVAMGYQLVEDPGTARGEVCGTYLTTTAGGERCSAADAFVHTIAHRQNVRIETKARVGRIIIEHGRARGVRYFQGNTWQEARANREVIVCAGVYMSPQILMLSGIGEAADLQRHEISVVADLPGVGKNLQDHLDYVMAWSTSPGPETLGMSAQGGKAIFDAILDWRFSRTGLLCSPLAEAGAFIKSDPGQQEPDIQLHFVPAIVNDHGRKPLPGHGMSIHTSLQKPKSRGTVKLGSTDPLAAPLIDPRYLDHPEDVERLVNAFTLVRRIFENPAFDRIRRRELHSADVFGDVAVEEIIRRRADTVYHPVGTCRMGKPASKHAVVDTDLKVIGIDGLRVADASVMPQIPSVNTNAASMMIGWRAGGLIDVD